MLTRRLESIQRRRRRPVQPSLEAPAIWDFASVLVQPQAMLSHWRLFEVSEPGLDEQVTVHIVGFSPQQKAGRVSAQVEEYDLRTARARTACGRVYGLLGLPGKHPDATRAWRTWLRVNNATVLREVTGQFLPATYESLESMP